MATLSNAGLMAWHVLHHEAWNRATTTLPSRRPSSIILANSSRVSEVLILLGRTCCCLRVDVVR